MKTKIVTWLAVLGLIAAMLPKPIYAQQENPQQLIARLQQDYAQAIAVGSMQVRAAQTVEAQIFAETATSCQLYASMDEEVPPADSYNHNFMLVEGDAMSGSRLYRSSAGHARITAVQQGKPDEGKPFYGQFWARSDIDQTVLVSEIGPDGNVRAQHFFDVTGDGKWHLWQNRIGQLTLTVSTDQNAPEIEIDALRTIVCDVDFQFLPALTSNDRNPPQPLDCGTGRTGRWRIGSETNQQIEQDLLLTPGSVTNHPQNSQFACWDRFQSFAMNQQTGERLDFMGEDRAAKSGIKVVAIMLVPGQSLPWWAESVVAITSRTAGVAVRYLVAISPWALLLGIGIGVIWIGWQLYLMSVDTTPIYPPVELQYSGSGRTVTFHSQQLAPHDVVNAGQFYLYRMESVLTATDWIPEFDRSQMVGFLQTATGAPAKGFVFSSQRITDKVFIDKPYDYAVLDRTADVIARKEHGVEGDWTDLGPIKEDEAKETADLVDDMLKRKEIPIDPTRPQCKDPITVARIAQDLTHFVTQPAFLQVLNEMLNRLGQGLAETRFEHRLGHRFVGSGALTHFFGHIFIDGDPHVVAYICVEAGNDATWVMQGVFDIDERLPYLWAE